MRGAARVLGIAIAGVVAAVAVAVRGWLGFLGRDGSRSIGGDGVPVPVRSPPRLRWRAKCQWGSAVGEVAVAGGLGVGDRHGAGPGSTVGSEHLPKSR